MILVTGATGHIGNVLIRNLLARGDRVRALLLPDEDRTPLSKLEIEIVEGDILDLPAVRQAVNGVEMVFHLAGLISILPGKDDLVYRVNVEGTKNILLATREASIRRLVYTSSIHALGRVPDSITIDEQLPFDPSKAVSEYDRSKAIATLEVLKAVDEGLDAVIVCPTGVIGPFDYRGSEMGQLILDTMNTKIHFSVEGAYDFVDVRDIARGMILACDHGKKGEHYILSGERITISKLIETVREVVGMQAVQLNIPIWIAKIAALLATPFYRVTKKQPRLTTYALDTVTSNSNFSHAKAERELGYSPRTIKETLADTVRWFMENRQHFTKSRKRNPTSASV